jgi:hypothetical protein
MRVICSIIALALLAVAVAPGAVSVPFARDSTPELRALDVCHTSSGNMSFDLPCLLSAPRPSLLPRAAGVVSLVDVAFQPILLTAQDERPPQQLI